MKVTLLLLALDARTTKYMSNSDCVVARAANRVLKTGYRASVGGFDFGIVDQNLKTVCNVPFGKDFLPEHMTAMAASGKDRKLVVEIPNKYLKPELLPAPKFDKYDLGIKYLCGIKDRNQRSEEVQDSWGNPVARAEKGGVLFSFLTDAPASSNYSSCFRGEDGRVIATGCISQIAKGDDAATESLKNYIKSAKICQPKDLRKLGVKALRRELKKYADIQRAMDICFRFKPENAVQV
jgi:hypothetical protein